MKKYLLLAVCLIMMSMTASALTINKAMLVHNDQVTLFDGDKIQDAVNAAVDGDAIYLTLGTFKPFNVTKKITIRGAGETSIIDGNVTISIPGSPTLTSPVLEALSVAGTVNVGSQVNDMILRKCKIADMTIGATVNGAVLDRCYITNSLTLSSYIKGMTVVNTKLRNVKAVSGATSNTTFVNCNIVYIYYSYFSATIINSIIGGSNSSINSTVLLNTLYYNYPGFSSTSVLQNCWSADFSFNNYCESPFTVSTLQSAGFIGTDGTVVGIYGGDTPYTLVPSVPTVTESNLELDMENKKLNVNLTVSPQ